MIPTRFSKAKAHAFFSSVGASIPCDIGAEMWLRIKHSEQAAVSCMMGLLHASRGDASR